MYRSTDSGASFTEVTSVAEVYKVGFGLAAPGQAYPAIFIWGTVSGVTGSFRSDDEAASWSRVNDDQHQFGWIHSVIGDPRVYGRGYVEALGCQLDISVIIDGERVRISGR